MRKQAIVIGLGQFGMSLARSLADKGVEVLAVDRQQQVVDAASEFAAEAICFDATDEEALGRTSPDRRDLAICAIGDESREASILVTALLRQMGAPEIVSRATDTLHERILRLVGAHEVVNPERAFGDRYAGRLVYGRVLEEIPLGPELLVTELELPQAFAGRSLAELGLPRRFGVTVVAVRRDDADGVILPAPNAPLDEADILVVVAKPGAVAELLERV